MQDRAEPLYQQIVERLRAVQQRGSAQQKVEADTWAPLVDAHRPCGEYVGQPCCKCAQPWPCPILRETLAAEFFPPL
jgi:hypothetical protein